MFFIVFATVLICMILVFISIVKDNSIIDKILAVNCFANYTIIFIVLLANNKSNNSFIDIALIYALVNFIATIAFLKYFRHKSL